ncbi:MAG: plasmid mobilization relaxosome protein MobC [Bacteroidota bacterium]
MSESKNNRTEIVQARVTPTELRTINNNFSRSTCRKRSDYLRKILLNKPVTIKQRNQSLDDFMAEMILLRKELSAIGNNYNQAIKRLHVSDTPVEVRQWIQEHANLHVFFVEKVSGIKEKINQIHDQWLQ